ncbi:MAG: acyl-CoA thioesterase [Saprospiraceae bacterium]
MLKPKNSSVSQAIMTEMIMPNDTNPLGNLMGGNLMRWMDIAAAICANRHAEAYCVTVSVDHLSFYKPIKLGHVITVEARVTRAFHTSMEVYVKVFDSDSRKMEKELANHAFFSLVALDDETLKPTLVPNLIAESDEDKQLYEGAMARRELRLLLSGRIEGKNASVLREVLDGNRFFF